MEPNYPKFVTTITVDSDIEYFGGTEEDAAKHAHTWLLTKLQSRIDLERLSRTHLPGFCKECTGAIPLSSRRWVYCSKECSDLFSMQVKPSFARKWVLRRDKGICVQCGLDCVAHRRDWLHHMKYFNFGDAKNLGKFYSPLQEIPNHKVRNKRGKVTLGTLWDMDHIIPVRDGGRTIPENLQTLCWWCHQEKTKEMRKV